eukprot:CAMPEP_0119558188 /NCGR_PEP_ID=MMETSP1352-20130426/10291_1 /TAXON_ID=265584 /ORGANISM="Stauroneis constricta, Strain CCMP1120" /LENGTH=607 /DNA_ID=CAMNT_0007605463 /DNA_START=49 /DNA_END=1872 /DNA_ORIENTATION=-
MAGTLQPQQQRHRRMDVTTSLLIVTTIVLWVSSSPTQVAAFSAHLSRPWDGQQQQQQQQSGDQQRAAASVRLEALKQASDGVGSERAQNSTSPQSASAAAGRDDDLAMDAAADIDAEVNVRAAQSQSQQSQFQQSPSQSSPAKMFPLHQSQSDVSPRNHSDGMGLRMNRHDGKSTSDQEDEHQQLEQLQKDFIEASRSTRSGTNSDIADGAAVAMKQQPDANEEPQRTTMRTSKAAASSKQAKQPMTPLSMQSKTSLMPSTSSLASSLSSSVSTTKTKTTAAAAVAPSSMSSSTSSKTTIRDCLPDLINMTRPINDPGVVLFHMVGIWLAIASLPNASMATFWQVAMHPSMLVVLVALLLTSSTSMLVNDYYDTKLGNDSHKLYQPLKDHVVPMNVAKRFLSVLYAAALVCTTMVPGIPARLSVMTGLILTFWYTQHLKPRTWLKNGVCASLIALAPLTSGMATFSLLGMQKTIERGPISPLLRLVGLLFVGILGREISMDLNDRIEDKHHGVWTVPVVYGPKFATQVSFVCSLVVSGLALAGPVASMKAMSPMVGVRRLGLALVGSVMQMRRAYQVLRVEGRDRDVVDKAVDEGLVSVVLLLASFV